MAVLGWLLNLGFAGGGALPEALDLDFATLTEAEFAAMSEESFVVLREWPLDWILIRVAAKGTFAAGAVASGTFAAGAVASGID